jgi:hypothetical protein
MRKWLWLGLLVSVGFGCGCATVTRTADENAAHVRGIARLDALQIGDDLNLIFLAERPTRLTRWITR